MADSSYDVGAAEGEIGTPRLKPKDFDDNAFSTPSKKNSHMSSVNCFSSPMRSFGRQFWRVDDSCSTAAPTPSSVLASTPGSWPSTPCLPKESPNGCDLVHFQDLQCVPSIIGDLFKNMRESQPVCAAISSQVSAQHDELGFTTPPVTPRLFSCDGHIQPSAPRRKPAPPLLQALQVNSEPMVREVIANDADAASLPFWDHNMEPPICCATRLSCDASIVSHLLEARADVNATNADGITALDMVRRPARRRGDDVGMSGPILAFTSAVPPLQNKDEVQRLLIAAGACLSECDGASDESFPLPPVFPGDMCLPKEDDIGLQIGAWPTMPPWQSEVTDMTPLLGSFPRIPIHMA